MHALLALQGAGLNRSASCANGANRKIEGLDVEEHAAVMAGEESGPYCRLRIGPAKLALGRWVMECMK
jgi:hypothetical protein